MVSLTRFWFEFDGRESDLPVGTRLGCGVTAYTCDDAIALIRDRVFGGGDLPAIDRVVENVDVSTLDEGHVLPFIDPPVWRGIWFSRRYPELH